MGLSTDRRPSANLWVVRFAARATDSLQMRPALCGAPFDWGAESG
jgi:hypothetical protein